MRDYETGKVTCQRCGEYLGNYLNDDYFKLISMKYCPICKESADRERKRLWARERRFKKKQETNEMRAENAALKSENELLRKQIQDMRNKTTKGNNS